MSLKKQTNDVIYEREIEENFRFGRTSHSYFDKYLTAVPELKLAIVTCMDCRITTESFGFKKPGNAIIIRTAGALFTSDVLRSLLIAIYELKVNYIAIVSHNDCGGKMSTLKMNSLISNIAKVNKITERDVLDILGKKTASDELLGFIDETQQTMKTVEAIQNHPLIPKKIKITGYLYDHSNGSISKLM